MANSGEFKRWFRDGGGWLLAGVVLCIGSWSLVLALAGAKVFGLVVLAAVAAALTVAVVSAVRDGLRAGRERWRSRWH